MSDAAGKDRALLTFLARAYKFKDLSDYGIGPSAEVTEAEATALIEEAARFLDRARAMIGAADPDTSEAFS